MILPVVKLGTLALKTACKPIANRLKKEAGLHPKFRQLIVNIAQANHRFMTNMQRRIYGHATDVAIRPLNEEKAVQVAADLLGELFVFTFKQLNSCAREGGEFLTAGRKLFNWSSNSILSVQKSVFRGSTVFWIPRTSLQHITHILKAPSLRLRAS